MWCFHVLMGVMYVFSIQINIMLLQFQLIPVLNVCFL